MAAGEYVSVSSQTDVEKADIERERQELIEMPEIELGLLAEIYERRGLKKETALLVAKELSEFDALGAHVRDELGINEISQAKPIQAAFASGLSFTGWRNTSSSCNTLSSGEKLGVLSLWLRDFLPGYFRGFGSKNWRFKYSKSSNSNYILGYSCYGNNCVCWIFIQCECLI